MTGGDVTGHWTGRRTPIRAITAFAVLSLVPAIVSAAVTVIADPSIAIVGEPVRFEAVLTNCQNGTEYRYWWELDGTPVSGPIQTSTSPCDIDPAPSLDYTFASPGQYEISFVYERRAGASNSWAGESGSIQMDVLAAGAVPAGTFNAVSPGTDPIAGPIHTQTAGDSIEVDIAALNDTGTALRNNYNGVVEVYLLDATDDSGAFEADTNCRSSWSVVGLLGTADFQNATNPQTISFPPQPDALRKARMRLEGTRGRGGGQVDIACAADAFAVRPTAFEVAVTDADRLSPGTARTLSATTANATPMHNAGRPFTIRAEAVNSAGVSTPGYDGTPSAVAAAPLLGANLGTLDTGSWSTSAGVAQTDGAGYSEVGAFRLEVYDDTFAAVDAGDTPLSARRIGPVTVDVGRFVPEDFQVAWNVPSFRAGCTGTTASFTYAGAPFFYRVRPVATLTAVNASGDTTTNYTGELFKVDHASLGNRTYAAAGGEVVDMAGLAWPDPLVTDRGDGTGSLTFDTGSGLRIMRGDPRAPFDAEVALSIDIADADGVVFSGNPARLAEASAGNGIDFFDANGAAAKQIRFGRAFIENAFGSEHMALNIPLGTAYYVDAATGFVPHADDNCSSGAGVTLSDADAADNLDVDAGETCVQDRGNPGASGAGCDLPGPAKEQFTNLALGGSFNLWLRAPGAGKYGTAFVDAEVPAWLEYDWNGDGTHDNPPPTARATFGSYRGDDRIVYWREVLE